MHFVFYVVVNPSMWFRPQKFAEWCLCEWCKQWCSVYILVDTMHFTKEDNILLKFERQSKRCSASQQQQHLFNGPLSWTNQVSRYQKGKNQSGFYWSKRQWVAVAFLGHMQICTSLQSANLASTPPLNFFTGRMPFLPPNRPCQSTEGNIKALKAMYSARIRIIKGIFS